MEILIVVQVVFFTGAFLVLILAFYSIKGKLHYGVSQWHQGETLIPLLALIYQLHNIYNSNILISITIL